MEPIDSWRRCSRDANFFVRFVARLEDGDPRVAVAFRGTTRADMTARFRSGLAMLLLYTRGSSAAAAALRRLGTVHGRSGLDVPRQLFAHWARCLRETVREVDPAWSPLVDAAWADALDRAIGYMCAHADAPPATAVCAGGGWDA